MKKAKNVLEACQGHEYHCEKCPYEQATLSESDLHRDSLELINSYEEESADKERYTIELYNRAREAEHEVKEWKQKFLDFDKFGDITTPIGLLPINTEGMRQLVDYCKQIRKETIQEVYDWMIENAVYSEEEGFAREFAKAHGVEVD